MPENRCFSYYYLDHSSA